jgi:hypothetical protein
MRSDPEHLPRAFTVAASDDRSVDVNKVALMKKLVDSQGDLTAGAKDCSKKIRTRPEMRDRPEILKRVPLFLQRVSIICIADNFQARGVQLPGLTLSLRLHQVTCHCHSCSGGAS